VSGLGAVVTADGAQHGSERASEEPWDIRFAQAEGYLQFADNRALVLVEEAIAPGEIDRRAFEAKLADARKAAENAEQDSEEQARALRDVKRYEAFLAVEA
jgi:F0F1-type ATP synthase epsilon subunit